MTDQTGRRVTGGAEAAWARLERELNACSREWGVSARFNRWIALEALRRAENGCGWRPLEPPLRAEEDSDELGLEPRSWPGCWRLRLSTLEREGAERGDGIGLVRTEHGAWRHGLDSRCA